MSISKYKLALLLTLIAVPAIGISGPVQLYQGEKRPPSQLALYDLTNAPGATSKYYFMTIGIDGRDLRTSPIGYGKAFLEPGPHTVRVSFIDYANFILPLGFKEKFFQGYYEITFVARAGMRYAPIFNLNLPKAEQLSEMCMAEVDQSKSLSATRKPMPYAGCGKPSLDPTPDNIKVCREWSWIGFPPKTYKDACAAISNHQ